MWRLVPSSVRSGTSPQSDFAPWAWWSLPRPSSRLYHIPLLPSVLPLIRRATQVAARSRASEKCSFWTVSLEQEFLPALRRPVWSSVSGFWRVGRGGGCVTGGACSASCTRRTAAARVAARPQDWLRRLACLRPAARSPPLCERAVQQRSFVARVPTARRRQLRPTPKGAGTLRPPWRRGRRPAAIPSAGLRRSDVCARALWA